MVAQASTISVGGYRGLGRLAFIANINMIEHELGSARAQIMTAAAGLAPLMTVPVVHVFCSLSGGTGFLGTLRGQLNLSGT